MKEADVAANKAKYHGVGHIFLLDSKNKDPKSMCLQLNGSMVGDPKVTKFYMKDMMTQYGKSELYTGTCASVNWANEYPNWSSTMDHV